VSPNKYQHVGLRINTLDRQRRFDHSTYNVYQLTTVHARLISRCLCVTV